MKKILLYSCVLAITLSGCEQMEKNEIKDRGKHTVKFSLSDGAETKLTGNSDENAVNNAVFIIFDGEGGYVTSAIPSGTSSEIELYEGEYEVAAVVNTDVPSAANSLNSIRALTVPLEDNSSGNIIMYGEKPFSIGAGSNDVTVNVKRAVAKISIGNIINDMKDPVFQKMEFEIKRIFVSNVSGISDLPGNSSPVVWYNKNGEWDNESAEIKSLLEDTGIDRVIPHKGNYEKEFYYYVYPNDTADDSYEAIWSPRYTRLVIEASIGGDICYYPIPFGNIEANHTYTINNLTVTKPGTEYPWEKIDGEFCNFTINVSDWEEGLNMDKTI